MNQILSKRVVARAANIHFLKNKESSLDNWKKNSKNERRLKMSQLRRKQWWKMLPKRTSITWIDVPYVSTGSWSRPNLIAANTHSAWTAFSVGPNFITYVLYAKLRYTCWRNMILSNLIKSSKRYRFKSLKILKKSRMQSNFIMGLNLLSFVTSVEKMIETATSLFASTVTLKSHIISA